MMKTKITTLIFLFCVACSAPPSSGNSGLPDQIIYIPDVNENKSDIYESPKDANDSMAGDASKDTYSFYTDPCVTCVWYFCPPLDSVWQKEMCINNCFDPPTIVYEGECIQYLECDPSQPLMGEFPCMTPSGYTGTQKKLCEKGKILWTDCETDCYEEICDGMDNDCDGFTDEDQLNACGKCGIVPPDICDGADNDCDGFTDEELIRECSTACGPGYETCVSGSWISCTAPPVLPEICDGFDNDCNGQIDDGLDCSCKIQDVGTFFPCVESPLLCGQGYKTCECQDPGCEDIQMTECYALCYYFPDPNETCDPFKGMELEEELCNNFDDNCNQLIDEDLYEACYTGSDGTLEVGACKAGELTCEKGTWGNYQEKTPGHEEFVASFCKGEVVPMDEVCNGIDDDCDGIIDYGEEMQETDILFIVDWSGSMIDEINAVMIALNQFAQHFSDEEVLQWGVILGPLEDPVQFNKEFLRLHHNLSGFTDFMGSLASLNLNVWTMLTGSEMLYDALYLALYNISSPGVLTYEKFQLQWVFNISESQPPMEHFKVNWRNDSKRIVILFSDEQGQSYLSPSITTTILLDAISGAMNFKLYTFSTIEMWEWDELAIASGGKWFKLSQDSMMMYNNLMEIIDEACLPK